MAGSMCAAAMKLCLIVYCSTFRIQSVVVEQKEELHIGFLVTDFFPALVHHVIYASYFLDKVLRTLHIRVAVASRSRFPRCKAGRCSPLALDL